jgi:uncharacterized membrane protein
VLIAVAIGLAATVGMVVGDRHERTCLAVISTVVVIMLMAALVIAGIVWAEWGH